MIISHKYKYVFVELPHTGSTAIRRELIELYGGTPILFRHATVYDFERIARPEEKDYFIFGSIRNPLDIAVTRYFRYKTDHNRRYTEEAKIAKKNIVDSYVERKQFEFVQAGNEFPAFFKKFYKVPYNTWSSQTYSRCKYIIRYENLSADFEEALKLMGITPQRSLPVVNRTNAKEKDFWAYYTPDIHQRAMRVFGPYMKQWGYEFPAGWGETKITGLNKLEFSILTAVRDVYWRFLRHRVMQMKPQKVKSPTAN